MQCLINYYDITGLKTSKLNIAIIPYMLPFPRENLINKNANNNCFIHITFKLLYTQNINNNSNITPYAMYL